MLSEREVHTDVRALLAGNKPFQYAHLIKFERPSRPDALSGRVSTSAQRYTYITDASRDVIYDDGSLDLNGNRNGPQVYIANKLLNVTSLSESTEAKADNCSVTLDGNGIGAIATGNVVIVSVDSKTWDVSWPSTVDLVAQGFREGDKIEFIGQRSGTFNISKFRENNTVRLRKIDNDLQAGAAAVSITLSSEEVKSILLDKTRPEYASFINREVYIRRAYFANGQLVGETPDAQGIHGPILMFRGIINNVSFEDDDSSIKVQWGLTSHWGDFAQVKGRITSDEFHRALDANGIPQPYSAIKPIYAYDKGFAHSETSLNLLATYTVMVDKTTVSAKNGFFGIGAKTKVKTVAVAEGRSTALDFQLQAKSIPVIYGVRNMPGLPIFADTLKSDSSVVYVIYALSEGQIGGLYDVYVEGKSLICNNQEDSDIRSKQNTEQTVDLICRGRADRGDVLGGASSISNQLQNYYYDPNAGVDLRDVWNLIYNRNALANYNTYVAPDMDLAASTMGRGVIHGESVMLTAPQEITIDLFSGTESQKAASQLVEIARAGNFKVQNDYWKGNDTSEYWGPNHRLIDTAYMVVKFKIKEGETSIPELDYVVRGKVLSCYNYDYSYTHDDKMTSENPSNFALGDIVQLSTGQTVQIIDKWSFSRPDGALETRFRFSAKPELQYVNDSIPTITRFSMSKGGATWTMTTYNYELHSGTVSAEISTPADLTEIGPGVQITYPPSPNIPVGGGGGSSPIYSYIDDNGVYRDALLSGKVDNQVFQSEVR